MTKREELTDPQSCMSKAGVDEMTFVLLGRDVAAPAAIRAWVEVRILAGKNVRHDAQILEALTAAAEMETRRANRNPISAPPEIPKQPQSDPRWKYCPWCALSLLCIDAVQHVSRCCERPKAERR